ncbi:sulfatase family protein [Lacipirellula sp.]|uniref:sulfatase family protein n=1 Tax=Lacipirellula sp. TaxID=2691419 RepID=UPI003D132BAE
MKRFALQLTRTIAAVAITAFGLTTTAHGADAKKPNVIVILADDLGWGELGAQGNKQIPTPNIDSIPANGVKFTQGYVSGPYCSPTRAGLVTGRYQTRFGHEWNPPQKPNAGLPVDQKTIADYLKSAGYATGVVGKWHLGVDEKFRPSKRGFDEFYGTLANTPFFHPQLVDSKISDNPKRVEDPEFYTTDAYGKRAVEFITEHKDEPFFLYLPFNAQHAPLEAPQKYLDRFPEIKDEKRKHFAAILSATDDAIGDVLKSLKDNGIEENTLVIYLADNGGPTQGTTSSNLPLRGVKMTTLEGGVRVPFYAQWKGKIPAGQVYENPIIQLDIIPTALAAAGVAVNPDWQLEGVDLLPYITGKNEAAPHDALFWRLGEQWAVRKGDWKLVASRIDGPQPRLFNLSEDIGEANDLAAKHPEKVAELRKEWEAWNEKNIPAAWEPNGNPEKLKIRKGAGKQARRKRAAQAGATATGQ